LLWHNPNETFIPGLGAETRFRLILIEKGSGILCIGERRIAFNAPALLCLNETETAVMEQCVDIKASGLYFHPTEINSAFSFENVHGEPNGLRHTDTQDRHLLEPFTDPVGMQKRLLGLAPITASHLVHKMAVVGQELNAQRDGYWPCRSRSYFLELLFLVHNLYCEPNRAEVGILSDVASTGEMGEVILYLHTHYNEKINLNDLARYFHTNRTTLSREFRAVTGLPVMTYLVNLRVHLASLLLRNTTMLVTEVMQNVGFIDDTHFTRTFRKYTRSTPSEYRQRHCWMLQ
jgi:AraC-like DNA-binding protein